MGVAQLMLLGRANLEGAPQNQTGGTGQTFLRSDGTCAPPSGGTLPTPANWMSIAPQPGVGDYFWIKATDTGGTGTAAPLTGGSIAAFTNMANGGPLVSIPSGIGTRTYSYQISNSATGSPVLSIGTGFVVANNT